MRWSESDHYFVSGSLKVYSVDLKSSEPLKLVPEENVIYDGPRVEEFKGLLLDNGFRVNRQGKAIVGVPKGNREGDYNFFFLETVFPLDRYGFTNEPSLMEEVKELKRLLEENKQEVKRLLEENRQEVKKLLEENRQEVQELKKLLNENRQEVKALKSLMGEIKPTGIRPAGSTPFGASFPSSSVPGFL